MKRHPVAIALLVCVAAAVIVFGPDIWHWVLTVTGDQTAGTRWNLGWSGFLSAGVISGGLFTSIIQHARGINCHAHGCWRIGTHPYKKDGVTHKLCVHCHPVLKGHRHTREQFHAHHVGKEGGQ
jgi:hypothetical protein